MDENNWNPPRPLPPANRPKRDSSRSGGGSPRNRHTRITSLMSRSPTYLDDVTISAMITSGMIESLGPMNFAQFRAPLRQNNGYPSPLDTFGSQIDYSLSWMPKNVNLPDWTSQSQGKGSISSRFRKIEQNIKDAQLIEDEDGTPQKDPRFLLQNHIMEDQTKSKNVAAKKQETIIEWFDRSVEKELRKRKEKQQDISEGAAFMDVGATAMDLPLPKGILERMAEASASRIEIATAMLLEQDTELTDAVEKLAKAEAMCAFAGAVKAAEAAAEAAPPELAEEAAVASARVFQTEVTTTSVIKKEVEGVKPMEVIGYIGVTKPKHPMKPC